MRAGAADYLDQHDCLDRDYEYQVDVFDIQGEKEIKVETTLHTNDEGKAHCQFLDDVERIEGLIAIGDVDKGMTKIVWRYAMSGDVIEERIV